MQKNNQPDSIRKRHTKRQLKRRRQQLRRRYTFFGILTLIVLCIILFVSPLFSIKAVNVEGNINIDTSELSSALEDLKGDNLFLTSSKDAKKLLSAFPYVDAVTVKKKYFPPSVTIIIAECKPSFYVECSDKRFALVDKNAKVLEITDDEPTAAELLGLTVSAAVAGETLSLDDNSKLDIVKNVLGDFDKSGILDGVTEISLKDLSDITFTYENRLKGLCGSSVNFSYKLSVFREAITSNRLPENALGTINLSKDPPRYTPDYAPEVE